jgi:hypothetical protein
LALPQFERHAAVFCHTAGTRATFRICDFSHWLLLLHGCSPATSADAEEEEEEERFAVGRLTEPKYSTGA